LAPTNHDLGAAASSGTASYLTTSTSYVRSGSYKIGFVGHSGTYAGSVNVTTATGNYRFSIDILDASCAVVATTGLTGDLSGTGVRTFSGSITWPAGGASVCLRIDVKKITGPGSAGCIITQDSNSFITVAL
jgi:hypothetical protein